MSKNLNIGFLAHVDAGKTTITENLLFLSGATRRMGRVDDGTSVTDYLDVERRRGISVKASSVSLCHKGVTVNIIDTPGHADFLSEVERALSALDLAVLILSSVEGVQPQTKVLFDALVRLRLPFVVFLNKIDRYGSDSLKVFDDLKALCQKVGKGAVLHNIPDGSGEVIENRLIADDAATEISSFDESVLEGYLEGELKESDILARLQAYESDGRILPVLTGSGKTRAGMEELLDFLSDFTPARQEDELCGVVYKLDHDKTLGSVAHIRLFGGEIKSRSLVFLPRLHQFVKTTQLKRIQGGKLTDIPSARAGELCAICGMDEVCAGDFIGKELPSRKVKLSTPHFMVKIECADEKKTELLRAVKLLNDEDPSLGYEWVSEKREIAVRTTGSIHLETLQEMLFDRFGLRVGFSKPSVIYKETPSREGYGYEHYTMPKPCWAVVHLFIQPLPAGSGIQFESVASEKDIHYKYQEHVKTSILETCIQQGLHGWEVVDAKFTLVGGEHHEEHTHPLDFFVATPMAFMDGLRNTGTTLLEPYLRVEFSVEMNRANAVIKTVKEKRGRILSSETDGVITTIAAEIPEGETFTLRDEFLSLTSGKGSYTSAFSRYEPVPQGMGCDRERLGVNPLDRAKWILHARQAL